MLAIASSLPVFQETYRAPTTIYAAFVFNCTPCHPLISSASIELTSLCCLTMDKPLNFGDSMDKAYMDPHPPLMSCTCNTDNVSLSSTRIQRSGIECNRKTMIDSITQPRTPLTDQPRKHWADHHGMSCRAVPRYATQSRASEALNQPEGCRLPVLCKLAVIGQEHAGSDWNQVQNHPIPFHNQNIQPESSPARTSNLTGSSSALILLKTCSSFSLR